MNPPPDTTSASLPLDAWPRPSLTVDVVVLTAIDGSLHVALYQREIEPGAGTFALPGGFVGIDESLDEAARRVLEAKAGIRRCYLEQLHTFGAVRRDPRGRVVTVTYSALVPHHELFGQLDPHKGAVLARVVVPLKGTSGGAVRAVSPAGIPLLLFLDHAHILGYAVARLRVRVDEARVVCQLLRRTFTLRELQALHETIRGESLNKDSFRRRMLASGQFRATGSYEMAVAFRPAELYMLR